MDIIGDRKFVELPGGKTHELPPLLVKTAPEVKRLDKVVDMANNLIEEEDLIPANPLDHLATDEQIGRRKMDLALNLVDQYLKFVTAWQWGDGVLEWIRQCIDHGDGDVWAFSTADSIDAVLHLLASAQ